MVVDYSSIDSNTVKSINEKYTETSTEKPVSNDDGEINIKITSEVIYVILTILGLWYISNNKS